MHLMAMSKATKVNFGGLGNFIMVFIASSLPLHADRFYVIYDLLQNCYLNTTMHLMAMSEATKVTFLGLGNFIMLFIAFALPLHADRFDVMHDILQHCYELHDHV